ncbi:MAG: signal recognition particle protein [Acidobacteriota bacterium]
MFESISEKFQSIFRVIKGDARITESNISQALREMKLALLEADVHFNVVKKILDDVKARALGEDVMRSLTPGQQFVKIVRDELEEILGREDRVLKFHSVPPSVFMLVGLQGSGKTTTAAKIGRMLKESRKFPFIVPADTYRPAAIDQLVKISRDAGLSFFANSAGKTPDEICREALKEARQTGYDCLIVDTAGRLHIDETLMEELERLKGILNPTEILYVADAMTGQDAVKSAAEFNRRLHLNGVILTKLDGDARGGAALSIKFITGVPIKFIGIGEKVDALEKFHPERMASRIIGMGDILSLIEKAEQVIEAKEVIELQKKLRREEFSLEDFRLHLLKVKKMGSIESLLGMIPGLGSLKGVSLDDKEIDRTIAIINSMNSTERENFKIIDGSRKRRIARGSGRSVQEINRLLKQFAQVKKMMRQIKEAGGWKGIKRLGLPFIGK